MNDAPLLLFLSNARQINLGAEYGLSDGEKNNEDKNQHSLFPADVGAKSGLEYVRYLVEKGVFKIGDSRIFLKPRRRAVPLSELRSEDIAFRFANVSVNDPPETIFCVSYNVLEEKPPHKWWEFFKRDGFPSPFNKGYVVMRLNGKGRYYAKMPPDPKEIAPLPPREPKFLDP